MELDLYYDSNSFVVLQCFSGLARMSIMITLQLAS